MNQKVATISIVIAAVVVVFVFLFLLSPQPPVTTTSPAQSSAAVNPSERGPETEATEPESVGVVPAFPSGLAWEDRLDQILSTKTDTTIMVRSLVSSMRQLPPAAQEQYAAHAVNLCGDGQFSLLGEVYLNAQTPQAVTETIFSDLLNRPDEIKLPLLAKTLRNAAHPMAGKAEEILRTCIGLEPATIPPNGWEQAVDAYLKQRNSP